MRRLAAILTLVAVAALAPTAHADRAFTPRFAADARGDVTLIGNTLMTCPATDPLCATAQAGTNEPPGRNNNNAFDMTYVDADADTETFDSSSAELALPAGAIVRFAGLYYGSEAPPSADRARVRFRSPADSGYSELTASVLDGTARRYQGFVDVTDRVAAAGNGTYTVADVQASTGENAYAGWALVVAYADPAAPSRHLTVLDGFTAETPVSIEVDGFTTPGTGPVGATVGLVGYEGDLGLPGDSMSLAGVTLADAANPADNPFNASVARLGTRFTAKAPDYINQLGFDADLFDASGVLGNGDTGAEIRLQSRDDLFLPGVVTLATEAVAPAIDLRLDKSASEASPAVGADFEYTLTVTNDGPGDATGVVTSDPLPTGVTFVSGPDGCAAAGGVVTCAVGSVDAGAAASRTFTVRAGRAAAGRTLTNGATVTGAERELDPSDNQATADVTVARLANLVVVKTASDRSPAPGSELGYLITVANAGPSRATEVAVTDLLPAGLALRSAVATQGACSGTACSLGALPAGAAVQVLVGAEVTAPAGAVVANTAVATALEPDADEADNRATETVTVGAPGTDGPAPDLHVANVVDAERATAGDVLHYDVVVENRGAATPDVRVTEAFAGAAVDVLSVRPSQGSCAGTVAPACRLGALDAGGRAVVRVSARTAGTGTLRHTATVAGGRESVATTTVAAGRARLAVRVRGRAAVATGALVRYRMLVRNRGPATALDVRLCDRVPRGLSFASAPGARLRGGKACWRFDALRAGQRRSVTLRARATRTGRVRNVATARARNAARRTDAVTTRIRP